MKKKLISRVACLALCSVALISPIYVPVMNRLIYAVAAVTTDTIDIGTCEINGLKDSYQYNSKTVTPNIKVTHGSYQLKQDTDYTVTYKNNNRAGQAGITVTGIGKYTGTSTCTFTITPKEIKKLRIKGLKEKYKYNPYGVEPRFSIYGSNNEKLRKNKDYTLTYSRNKKIGTGRVRIKFIGNYSGTYTKTFKITQRNIRSAKITGLKKSYNYSGRDITPKFTVTFMNKTLKKGTDYTVSYQNNNDMGTSTIRIQGKGNYRDTAKVTFKIVFRGWITKDGKKYYYDSNGNKSTGLTVIRKKTYLFNDDGSLHTGWKKIKNEYYYFDRSNGRLLTNTSVDGIKLDRHGKARLTPAIRAKIETMITARNIMLEITDANDSLETKRLKCFKWGSQYPYHRFRKLDNILNNEGWESTFANDIFKFKSGCCVSQSCAVAFLFNELGYDEVYVGHDTSHAWVQIGDRLFDPLFSKSKDFNANYNAIPTDYRRVPPHLRYIG